MHDAEQVPLSVYFFLAAQGESIQADGMADIGKGRLADGQSHAVNGSTGDRIDFLFHSFGKGVFLFLRSAVKIGNLATFGYIRLFQALRTEQAGQTVPLGSFKSGGKKSFGVGFFPASVQSFSRRAYTVGKILGEDEMICLK